METFSALLAICAGNSPVPGEFPAQRPVTRSFDVFFVWVNDGEADDMRLHRAHYDVTVMYTTSFSPFNGHVNPNGFRNKCFAWYNSLMTS